MRVFGPLLCCALLGASPTFAVPVVASRPTNDPWEVHYRSATAPCENIRSEVVFIVPPASRDRAIEMLKSVPVQPLDEHQAADLLQRPASVNLLADLLGAQVNKLWAQQKASPTHREVSWGNADIITVSDLVTMMQTHYPPYRPYLVRALSGDRPTPWGYFRVHLCGPSLEVDSTTAGLRALRTPLIVFLQSAPATVEPVWFPGPPTEGRTAPGG